MTLLLIEGLEWWQFLILMFSGILLSSTAIMLRPVFGAVAVVIVAKSVNEDLAKLAIPLILRPLRPPSPGQKPKNTAGISQSVKTVARNRED